MSEAACRLRVMSFNIWCDHPRHPAWTLRLPPAVSLLRYHRPDVIGGQEFRLNQIRDIERELPEYHWVGVGRDDGKEAGEFSPIFYRHERFQPAESGTFWLSAAPENPGKGWDAMCPRVVTWARLLDRESGCGYTHFNTHFDHFGRRARREGARLLLRRIAALSDGKTVVVTGDLNCLEGSAAYTTLTGPVPPGDRPAVLRDTLRCCHFPPLGPRKTWGGFLPGKLGGARLDYIFAGEEVDVWQHAVLTDHGHDGRYPSDHRPVVAELEIRRHAVHGKNR